MAAKGSKKPELEIRKMVVTRLESGWDHLLVKHEQEKKKYFKRLELAKELLKKAEEDAAKQKGQK